MLELGTKKIKKQDLSILEKIIDNYFRKDCKKKN